jgi:hypothetical protein
MVFFKYTPPLFDWITLIEKKNPASAFIEKLLEGIRGFRVGKVEFSP